MVEETDPLVDRERPLGGARRAHVLEAALITFARHGYRKTSMEQVARAADISRPGLYLLFASKPDLFRAAVTHALETDVDAAERTLADTSRPLRDRLVEAFDLWTGRYVGPMVSEVPQLIETRPELLGSIATDHPRRFLGLVTAALGRDLPAGREGTTQDVARTLTSTAGGVKHEVGTRAEFVARMTTAVDLLVSVLEVPTHRRPSRGRQ